MSDTEWVKVEDWSTVEEGQRVMLGGDGIKLPATITAAPVAARPWNGEWVRVLFAGMADTVRIDHEGWSLFIEKPTVQLPTTPGWYLDGDGDIWQSNGLLWRLVVGQGARILAEHIVDPALPFTLLRPVAEVAAETFEKAAEFLESEFRPNAARDLRKFVEREVTK